MIALGSLNKRRAANLRPPKEALPFHDFCRTLKLPDGPHAGNLWIPDTEPTQAAFVRHFESGKWRTFTIVAPSQRGKTLKGILAPTLWSITEGRTHVAYVMPNLEKLQQNYEGKIKPAIVGTGFGDWLPTKGPGSKGGKPGVLTLRDPSNDLVAARLYFMSAGKGKNETSVSSVTTRGVVFDEADDAIDIGQIKLVYKRAESYGADGWGVVASTVNDRTGREAPSQNDPDAAHPILVAERMGSQHRQHHKCPHCAGYFVPQMEHLDLERMAIVCPLCGALWSEDDRHQALNNSLSVGKNDRIADGRVVEGEYPDRRYSELTTGLDYHMADIRSICSDVIEGRAAEQRGEYSLMRTCMHKVFCKAYTEPTGALEITNKGLAVVSSLSDYTKRVVPHWVTHLAGAVDVQDDRHYWGVLGIGPDDRHCIVDWGYELLVPFVNGRAERRPTAGDRRIVNIAIDALFNKGWTKEGGSEIFSPLPGLRGIDVGDGEVTAEITNWLRGMRGWRAVRGAHRDNLRQLGKILELPPEAKAFVELRQPDGWPVSLCNVMADTARRYLHAALLRPAYTPGSCMLPRGLEAKEPLLLHLSGKVWVDPTEKGGKTIEGFWNDKAHPRHDWLDVFTYAIAMGRMRKGVQTAAAAAPRRKYGNVGQVTVRR